MGRNDRVFKRLQKQKFFILSVLSGLLCPIPSCNKYSIVSIKLNWTYHNFPLSVLQDSVLFQPPGSGSGSGIWCKSFPDPGSRNIFRDLSSINFMMTTYLFLPFSCFCCSWIWDLRSEIRDGKLSKICEKTSWTPQHCPENIYTEIYLELVSDGFGPLVFCLQLVQLRHQRLSLQLCSGQPDLGVIRSYR